MSITIAEVSQILTAIAAVGGVVIGWRNSRQIEVVRHATNSLTDKLVAVTKTESYAAGVKDEKDRVSND